MRYVLDANVLIAAHREYYAPDICPGFWDFTANKVSQDELVILDKVHAEIKGPPKLVNWVNQASQGLLVSAQNQYTEPVYDKVIDWVNGNQQFTQIAKDDFANGADGWLVAYTKVVGIMLVTNEPLDPKIKKRVPIPNVCKQFNVPYMHTYKMLRTLKARFKW